MRLEAIQAIKARVGNAIPECPREDISERINLQFRITPESGRRRLMRLVASAALGWQRRKNEVLLGAPLSFHADALCLEERFGDDASTAALLGLLRGKTPERVLVPGCYLGGEDVQFWLRRGVKRLDGVDLNSLAARWRVIVPALKQAYGAEVEFQQAPLERLPFAAETFDVVATAAVLEHVQNLDAISAETSRVLKRGGLAWHSFGPLYYSFGADHCIAAYGDHAGFDHLLLSEADYEARIHDQAFFDRQPDPNLPFWARRNQFSFATAREYLDAFRRYFQIRHVVAKISGPAITFRQHHPQRWSDLVRHGVREEDLLIKGLTVILEKN